MAKIYGLFGAMTGKVADAVMVVRNGEQVVRKYQPVVSNPSTLAQIAARAKMKLMSQLSAVMSPVIAIPRMGAVSSRNLFVKKNYGISTFADNEASIQLANVQLTSSVVALPAISAARRADSISAYLSDAPTLGNLDVDRVVYCMFEKQSDNRLRFVDSKVATTAGDGGWGVTDLPLVNNEVVILAYGVRDNTEAARVAFGNLEAIAAQQVAKLVTSRTLTEADVTLTETRGFTLAAASTHLVAPFSENDMRSSKKK